MCAKLGDARVVVVLGTGAGSVRQLNVSRPAEATQPGPLVFEFG